jgi:hypothetical protein
MGTIKFSVYVLWQFHETPNVSSPRDVVGHALAFISSEYMGELLHFTIRLLKSVFSAHLNLANIKIMLLSHGLNFYDF